MNGSAIFLRTENVDMQIIVANLKDVYHLSGCKVSIPETAAVTGAVKCMRSSQGQQQQPPEQG